MGKHFHIHFAPKKTRDQAGSVPPFTLKRTLRTRDADAPPDVTPLVEALMQAIAERQGTQDTMTHDAGEWQEHLHPRAEGGQFTSAQHTAAAENHESASMGHGQAAEASGAGPLAAMHQKAAAAHKEAAEAHGNAAKHIDAGTGLGEEFAKQAHSKTYQAAGHSQKLDGLAGGNMMGAAHAHLKKIASDPKQSVGKRAEAAEKLAKLEKSANAVANSPHAKAERGGLQSDPNAPPQVAHGSYPQYNPATGEMTEGKGAVSMTAQTGKPAPSGKLPERRDAKGMTVGSAQNTQARIDAKKAEGAATAPGQPGDPNAPAGTKPTQGPGGPAKAATHALLSSGHPFSVDELMQATGVTQKSTMMTALSDLKNPKYAGKLGALQIEKGADGMYRVTKAPEGGFKAVGAAATAGATGGASPAAPGSIAQPPGEGAADPNAVVHGSHPLSDYMPGQTLKAKGASGKEYKVLGHNAEGHVIVQSPTGVKHHMEPAALKNATQASPTPVTAQADNPEGHTIIEPPSRGLVDGPGTPDPSINPYTGKPRQAPKPMGTPPPRSANPKPSGTTPEHEAAKASVLSTKPFTYKPADHPVGSRVSFRYGSEDQEGEHAGKSVTPAAPAQAAGGGRLSDLHTSEISRRLSENYSKRPSSEAKRFGSNGPTPEQAAAYKKEVNAHQNERSKLMAAHKVALARENAAHMAKYHESGTSQSNGQVPAAPPAKPTATPGGAPHSLLLEGQAKAALARKGISANQVETLPYPQRYQAMHDLLVEHGIKPQYGTFVGGGNPGDGLTPQQRSAKRSDAYLKQKWIRK